jgi:hypothetical protein
MRLIYFFVFLLINISLFGQINPNIDDLKKTNLSIIEINVANAKPIISKEEYLKAVIKSYYFINNEYKSQTDSTEIRGRGNSSWTDYPKKPYRLKLFSSKTLLGMPSNRHWALIANYIDRSLIRNKTAYDLSKYFGLKSASKSEMTHLILNGAYQGVYQLTEVIKIGKDRVDIDAITRINGNIQGGVILEISDTIDETYSFNTDIRNISFQVKDPDDLNTKSAEEANSRLNYIKNVVNNAENALFSEKYQDSINGYYKYYDLNSLVRWYLIEELFRNIDAEFRRSVYMYIDTKNSNKITMGPVWDFDISSGVNTSDPQGYWIKEYENKWYSRLFQDSNFVNNLKTTWSSLRSSLHKELYGKINAISRQLNESQILNFKRWEYVPYELPILVFEKYNQEIFYLKKWLKDRIEWMDTQFNYNEEKLSPITSDLHLIINEDEKTTFDLLSYGKINNKEAFEIVQQTSKSQLSLNDKTGQITYLPEKNFNGLDTLKYRYFDGELWSDTGLAILEILPVNDEPMIENSITDSLLEDNQLNINTDKGLLCCISDPDDNSFTIESYVEPKLGSIEVNKDGSFRYTPFKDVYGFDTVFFTIKNTSNQTVSSFRKLSITPVNDPALLKNISLTLEEDNAINIKIDKIFIYDVDDTVHSVFITQKPVKGEIKTINPNELKYIPNENFNGIDSLQIKVKDQIDFSNTSTIKITVTPVNDKPYSIRDLFYQAKTEDTLHIYLKDLLSAIIDPDDDSLRIYNTDDIDKDFKILETQNELTLFNRNNMPGIYRKQLQISDNKAGPVDLKLTIRILPNPKKSNFKSIKLFPNPTNGVINLNDLEIDQIKIFDIKGPKIIDRRFNNKITNNSIDLFGLSKGVYKVAIFNKNQLIAIKSIIIN